MTSILSIRDLEVSFYRMFLDAKGQSQSEKKSIINKLCLEVPKKVVTAIIGGNGAGKTVLLNLISGLLEPDSGEIHFCSNGKMIRLDNKQAHQVAQLGIGRMFQDSHIFYDMTVFDNMRIADDDCFGEQPFFSLIQRKKYLQSHQTQNQKIEEIFERLLGENNSFWKRRQELARTLSFGEQRLLGLMRLFMSDSDLLLLDEPTAGINSELIEEIQKIILALVEEEGKTVLVIEHNMDVVKKIATYCAFMDEGSIEAFGETIFILEKSAVVQSYLGL